MMKVRNVSRAALAAVAAALCLSFLAACGAGNAAGDSGAVATSGAAASGSRAAADASAGPVPDADGVIRGTSIALRGAPKYRDGFAHFDYVNPDAPKGGSISYAAIGTFDNFHRYALRGVSAAGSEQFYDTLLVSSDDEIEVYYPLVAEWVEYAADFSWIIYHINPAARDVAGRPLTADDVVFSFNTFYEKGVPQFKSFYRDVKVEALDALRVKFTLPRAGDKELMLATSGSKILPRAYWQGRDFSEPLITPPEGSGAYRVKDYKMGQYVVYERIPDYWAKDLPVNKGRLNFDTIRYDYYRDDTVAFEAFKAGEFDFRQESVAANWATKYTGPAFDSGRIVKEEIPHEIPQGMDALTFNITRPIFSDVRVRRAIGQLFDFEWMNRNIFYGQYTRTRSYFQNTEYAATGLPTAAERAILEPIRDKIPAEVFTKEYQPPKTDGSGNQRIQMREALRLLAEAGWELKDQKLVNVASGEAMSFELLIYSPTSERYAIPFQQSLAKIGIELKIRMVDTTQYINRLRERDFDLIDRGYDANAYPSSSLNIVWHTEYVDSTWNTAGVTDPAVDYLIEGIAEHQQDDAALLAWGRALDRVLTWNHYVVPQWHLSKFRVAYADKFAKPKTRPKYAIGLDTWWAK